MLQKTNQDAPAWMPGEVTRPAAAIGVVLLAHRQGTGRQALELASVFASHRLATLRFELLDRAEAQHAEHTSDLRLLAIRWRRVIAWAAGREGLADLPQGLFGAGVDAAGALHLLAFGGARGRRVAALVSCGACLELLGAPLGNVDPPTLLLVAGGDPAAVVRHRTALQRLTCRKRLEVVPGAGSQFDRDGACEVVAQLGAEWFATHLDDARWA